MFAKAGCLWRTRAELAKFVRLDRGLAEFVALRTEGFACSFL
jgi:hypothetical protein